MKSACLPLEIQQQYTQAFRCYANVTAFLSDPRLPEIGYDPKRAARLATAHFSSPAPVAPVRPRPVSSLLASNHILLGVGF